MFYCQFSIIRLITVFVHSSLPWTQDDTFWLSQLGTWKFNINGMRNFPTKNYNMCNRIKLLKFQNRALSYFIASDSEPTWYFPESNPPGLLSLHLRWSCWRWSSNTPEHCSMNIFMYFNASVSKSYMHFTTQICSKPPWLSWLWPPTPLPLSPLPQWSAA